MDDTLAGNSAIVDANTNLPENKPKLRKAASLVGRPMLGGQK